MQQTSLYIPNPCHEDWNKMTSTQQGKFCSSCSKQVIDFSLMSDNQILNLLSYQSGKLCGRFDAQQLQRPLAGTKNKKKKSWWMALTMPLLFLFDRSEAQENTLNKTDTIIQVEERKDLIVGKLIYQPSNKIIITGKVVDENNNPLSYASVVEKNTKHGVACDSLGGFSINIQSGTNSATLIVSYVGYETSEQNINLINVDNQKLIIKLNSVVAAEVVVTASIDKIYTRTVGGLSICHKITTFQKIDSSFKKALGISKVFPNPAPKGSAIYLTVKTPGEYQMQLLDNQSRLMQADEMNTTSNNSTKQIQLSSNLAAGIYYLRLINEQTKKLYTEKIFIQ